MILGIKPFSLYAGREVSDRGGMIGGSSWGDILKVQPYGCRRRFRFAFDNETPDQDYVEPVWTKRGRDMEETITRMYCKKYGAEILSFEEMAFYGEEFSGDVPDWSWPHPDAIIVKHPEKKGRGILDAKCVFPKTMTTIVVNGIPDTYKYQLTHYMAATKYEWAALAVLDFMNWELVEIIYNWDPSVWEMLKKEGEKAIEECLYKAPLPPILPNDSKGDPHKSCQTCRYFHTCRRK